MEKISISINLLNGILAYLDARPHNEVRRLIDLIQTEAQQAASQAQTVKPEDLKQE